MTTAADDGPTAVTARSAAKAERRRDLLGAAAALMARRGYASVRLEDIGAAVGVSGPAMYRHFANKQDLLAQMLTEISERLLAGGTAVVTRTQDPMHRLRELVDVHVRFALTEPDLITVQSRDLASLDEGPRDTVRRLQRRYVDLWADAVADVTGVDHRVGSARAHAVFGLINAAPRMPDLGPDAAADLLGAMARAALTVPPDDPDLTAQA
ncbi:TetR/AcrR family transcriptional regulator [Williamsia sp. SKLECPSW1]